MEPVSIFSFNLAMRAESSASMTRAVSFRRDSGTSEGRVRKSRLWLYLKGERRQRTMEHSNVHCLSKSIYGAI